MRKYILTPPKQGFPGWPNILDRYGGRVRVVYRFETGVYYIEMDAETKNELAQDHPEIIIERIAVRDE